MIGKPRTQRDVGQLCLWAFEHVARALETARKEKAVRGRADGLLEGAGEMRG